MKPLVTLQRCLIWLCIHPAEETASIKQKRAYVTFAGLVLGSQIILIVTCLAFCCKNFLIDLERCMFTGMILVVIFGSVYMMIVAIIQMHQKTAAVFEDLTTIYENYESEISFRFLARANITCEWIAKFYFKYTIGIMISVNMVCAISILYCWLTRGHLNADYFFHPVPVVLPWNQTTLLGYFGEMLFLSLSNYCYLIVTGIILLFFVSMCIYHRAFYKVFKHSIDKVKESKKNPCDAKFLCDLIRFHISVKNLFLSSAEIFSPIVMVQLLCSTVNMAVAVFYFDLQFQHFGFEVIVALTSFSVGMVNAFLYCFFGAMANDSYDKMCDSIFELNWYELPIDQQKYFILMGANMQRPLDYHGFGVLYANLETFTRILRSVFSYYGAIKTITSK